jgi:isohexenylglutaconyl-CoA hydratase
LDNLLDYVAVKFAEAVTTEGMEGTMAFVQKRLPSWAE